MVITVFKCNNRHSEAGYTMKTGKESRWTLHNGIWSREAIDADMTLQRPGSERCGTAPLLGKAEPSRKRSKTISSGDKKKGPRAEGVSSDGYIKAEWKHIRAKDTGSSMTAAKGSPCSALPAGIPRPSDPGIGGFIELTRDAINHYEKFHHLPRGTATWEQV